MAEAPVCVHMETDWRLHTCLYDLDKEGSGSVGVY